MSRNEESIQTAAKAMPVGVDDKHYIQGATLTDRFVNDCEVISNLASQIKIPVGHSSADTAYDNNTTYDVMSEYFPEADIIIPPAKNAVYKKSNHQQRNRNILEIACFGRMGWQRARNYGQRNYSELAIQRYKRILGNTMQAREFENQKQEAMIGCGILNKMTSIGMPKSYRIV